MKTAVRVFALGLLCSEPVWACPGCSPVVQTLQLTSSIATLVFMAALLRAAVGFGRRMLAPSKKTFPALRNHQASLAIGFLTFALVTLANVSTKLVFLTSFEHDAGRAAVAVAYVAWGLFLALIWILALAGIAGGLPVAPTSHRAVAARVTCIAIFGALCLSPMFAPEQFPYVAWGAYALFPLGPLVYWLRRVRHEPFLVRALGDSRLTAAAMVSGIGFILPFLLDFRSKGVGVLLAVAGLILLAGSLGSLVLAARAEIQLRRLLVGPDETVVEGGLQLQPHKGLCRVCAEPCSDAPVLCERCQAPYHQPCWTYAGQCAVYGCGGKQARAS